MTKRQPFQKPQHIYSIEFVRNDTELRIYRVIITGDAKRDFFAAISPSQNARGEATVKRLIEAWCNHHFDKLAKDGESIPIDLDEEEIFRATPKLSES